MSVDETGGGARPMSEPAPSRSLRGAAVLADPLVAELLAYRLVPVLTTLEPDGAVHAVAIWAATVDEAIVLATGSASRKVRNLERDPRATIVFHDSRPGFEVCGASIRGIAEFVRGEAAAPLVALVHDRYVTPSSRKLPGPTALLASDDVAILIRPETAITWDMRATDASAELRRVGGALPLEPTSPRP
jgi:PPOX class probable F420-dependent enzyme